MTTSSFGLTTTEGVLPKLALDFTTASLDSRVTFTRTTGVSNPATYVNSSGYVIAATNNQPRFDYDPVTLACKGLLIEESRTNSLLYSETFSNTSWTYYATGLAQGSVLSPDGANNAYKLTPNATSTQHLIESANVARTAQAYTISAYVYADGYNGLDIAWGASRLYANFNLVTGTVVNAVANGTDFTNAIATITALGGGYYRVTLTGTAVTTTAQKVRFAINSTPTFAGNSGEVFAGDNSKGIYIWGAQLEAGAFATSYIPTTTTALTRNADVATITGTNFSSFWQATRGGVLVRARPGTVSGTRPWVQFDDGTADEIIALRGNATNPELYIVDGGTPQAQIDAGTIAAGTSYRLAGTWAANNCAASLNSGTPVPDAAATIPTVTQARLGSDGTNYLNGHLEAIEYWDEFLTPATLQSVTTSAGYRSIVGPVMRDTIIA